MASNKNVATQSATAPTTMKVVNQEIQLRTVDRTPKDIGRWRRAHQAAESVYSPQRRSLYDVYADVELDGHLTGIMGKRIDEVLNKEWQYLDAKGKKVDDMDLVIESDAFQLVLKMIMKQLFWGLSGMEFIPGAALTVQEIPVKHIKPELGLITIEQTGNTGIPYEEVPSIWVLGTRNDYGLLLKCAPYAIYKKGNWGDWAQFIEIYGQPVRVMKYNLHDLESKAALKKTLDESGSSLAIMIPEGVDFDLKDGKTSNGDGKLQDTFKEALNAEMSVIVLGNTETTTNGKTGSQAKTKEHSNQQLTVTKSDLKRVTNALNSERFQNILRSYGLPVVEGGKFQTQRELNMEALKASVDVHTKVAQQVPVGDDFWYETYGIPKPENYDELKKKQEESRAAIKTKASAKSEGTDPEEEDLFAGERMGFFRKIRLLFS